MKYIKKKLGEIKGNSELLSSIVGLFVIIVVINGGVSIFGELNKINNLTQIAQSMAREISLTGEINDKVTDKLESLEKTMKMKVDMTVEGQYLGGSKKLKPESDFTVIITYISGYRIGFIDFERKDVPYVKKANGTAEEYHKQ